MNGSVARPRSLADSASSGGSPMRTKERRYFPRRNLPATIRDALTGFGERDAVVTSSHPAICCRLGSAGRSRAVLPSSNCPSAMNIQILRPSRAAEG